MSNAGAEQYIPNARDAIIAYFGRVSWGPYRCFCVSCHDRSPLLEAVKVYGDFYVPEGPQGSIADSEACDCCGVTLLSLAQACQREHDEQQARWARMAAPTVPIEYGIPAAIRCRVY